MTRSTTPADRQQIPNKQQLNYKSEELCFYAVRAEVL
jgi:hypothetical protein